MKTKRHLMKNIVSFVIAIALVIGMILVVPTTMTVRADDKLAGEGTLASPYLISSKADWETFSNVNNSKLYWGSGVYVKLTADIGSADDPITTMVGTYMGREYCCFAGIFNGCGHKLTVNYVATDDTCAPFRYVNHATIRCLYVDGIINNSGRENGGLIGWSYGSTSISSCIVTTSITCGYNGDSSNGGFVAKMKGGSLTFKNCKFAGKLLGSSSDSSAGFLGWRDSGNVSFSSCLYDPSENTMGTSNSATFNRNGGSTFNNCYYTEVFGTSQGDDGSNKTDDDLVKDLGTYWKIINGELGPIMDTMNLEIATINGINNKYYGNSGDTITINYTVSDSDGTELVKGVHYSEVITNSSNKIVSDFVNEDAYTLTITGISPYYGSQQFKFTVDYPEEINIIQQQNGTITSDKNSALPDEKITITATPALGYYLKSVNVIDANNNVISFNRSGNGDLFRDLDKFNTVTFSMPSTAVTVIPVFSNSLTYSDGLIFSTSNDKKSTLEVTIPEGISSFSLSSNSSSDYDQEIKLTAPEGCYLSIKGDVKKASYYVLTENEIDFNIYNGADTNAVVLKNIKNEKGSFNVETTGNSAVITYKVGYNDRDCFYYSLTVTVVQSSNSNITISDIPDETYNGEARTPLVEVYENGNLLNAGIDYDVEYINNVYVGEGVAKIIGKGTHSGIVVRKKFNIKPKKVTLKYDSDIASADYGAPDININGVIPSDTCYVVMPARVSWGINKLQVTLSNSNYEIDGSNTIVFNMIPTHTLNVKVIESPKYVNNLIYTGISMDLITPGSLSISNDEYAPGAFSGFIDNSNEAYFVYKLMNSNEYMRDVPKASEPGKYYVDYKVVVSDPNFYNNNYNNISGTIEVDIKYQISFDHGEGSGTMDLDGMENDGTYTLPECTFTAPSGKAFKNWYVKVGNNAAITKNPGDEIKITNNTTVTAIWEKIVQIHVYKYDENGDDIPGDIQGLGEYLAGSEQTLIAPAVDGYNFDGWYKYSKDGNHRTGNRLWDKNVYTYTVADNDTSYVAVYKALGDASITINCAGSFTVDGAEYTTQYQNNKGLGKKITLVANGDKFAYWENKYGMVLSRSRNFTFTVTGNEIITAVFDNVANDKATVIFESAYGQVLLRKQLASGESNTISLPGLPTLNGYTAQGWDLDGNGSYDSSLDTIEAAITRGLNNSSKTVTIKPVYKLKDKTYTITVIYGTGGGEFKQNDKVTVVADTPAANMKFSHWTDGTNILCYNSRFTFFADRNLKLTAVYVAENDVVEAKAMTEIIEKYSEDNNLVFVSLSTVPEGFKIVKAGVILTNDADIVSSGEFDDKNATYVLGDAWSGTTYRYTLTKSNVANGDTWYARGYLIYTDKNGNTDTIYSAVVEQTYTGN